MSQRKPGAEPDSEFRISSPAGVPYHRFSDSENDVTDESVTHWLGQLKAGDWGAAEPLWQRYFPKLVALARARLAGLPRRAADEEDVALSAFDSFCRDAAAGRLPRLDDRDDLWRVLLFITGQKAVDLGRRET